MKKTYKLLSLLFFFFISITQTLFASEIKLKNSEELLIQSDQSSESVSVENDALLKVISKSTLTVGDVSHLGDFHLKNGSKVTVEQGSMIIIYGDLIIDNDAKLVIDGKVKVYGNIILKNSALIDGEGTLEYGKSISLKNDAEIKVNKLYNPDSITSISSADVKNEIISIFVYNLEGRLLKSLENIDSSYLNLAGVPELTNEKILLLRIHTPSKVYSEKRFNNN